MSSKFAALDAQLSGAVDFQFADTLRHTPKAKQDNFGNTITADSRSPADVLGVLIEGAADISFLDGDRRLSDFNARGSRQDAYVTFDKARFPAGQLPRKGDTIATIAPAEVKTFEIVDTLDDGARIVCPLVRK